MTLTLTHGIEHVYPFQLRKQIIFMTDMNLKTLLITLTMIVATGYATAGNNNEISFDDIAHRQTITVKAVTDNILQVSVSPDDRSAITNVSLLTPEADKGGSATITTTENDECIVMRTATGMRALIDKNMGSLSINYGTTLCVTDMCDRSDSTIKLLHAGDASFYGAGERGYSFNLAGDTLINYNAQSYGYQGGEHRINQMGITMPMVISSKGYGIFFDDFAKSSLALNSESIEYKTTSPYVLSYYIIGGNGRVEDVVKRFTWLVGRQDLPPLWTLGYITSKYGYRDQRESEGTVDTLKRAGYPLDGIVFDLYWYGKEEDMGRLEWDKDQWPDHRRMLADFKEKGVNVVTISQPYVLRNGRAIDNYRLLDSKGLLCKTDGTDTTQNVVIWVGEGGMFDMSNPDTRRWLADRYHSLTEQGVTGWWGDLGEPEKHPLSIRHYNNLTAEQYHNYYGNEWSRIIYDMFKQYYPDRRLMTMMRAGTAGLQRYSVFPWSTDVSRSWGGLAPQVTIMLNSGLSGLGYMSHDVGGFAVDPANKRDGELYIRWLQLGLFSPVLRTHSTYQAEPYNYTEFGDLTLRIIRQRYAWLPYNYTLAYENATTGLPLVRPIGLYEPGDGIRRYDKVSDQFLWGNEVMVAPVMTEGATERLIEFPEGEWIDYNDPTVRYNGHTSTVYNAPIDVLPVFVRAGSFIPQARGKMENTGDYNPDVLDINYYPSNENSQYTLFDDDLHSTGTTVAGKHRLITFEASPGAANTTHIHITGQGTFDGAKAGKQYNLVMQGMTAKPAAVTVNDKKVKATFDRSANTVTVPVAIKDISQETTIVVKR